LVPVWFPFGSRLVPVWFPFGSRLAPVLLLFYGKTYIKHIVNKKKTFKKQIYLELFYTCFVLINCEYFYKTGAKWEQNGNRRG